MVGGSQVKRVVPLKRFGRLELFDDTERSHDHKLNTSSLSTYWDTSCGTGLFKLYIFQLIHHLLKHWDKGFWVLSKLVLLFENFTIEGANFGSGEISAALGLW